MSSGAPSGPSAARTAFQDALNLVRSQQPDDKLEAWLKDKYTQADVTSSIEHARQIYESRSNSKARTWLGKLSSGILSYGKVLDMLAQHHPEYVSLAWGTTKLLFILFQNHDELVTELAKSMAEISDILPRTDRYLAIYNSPVLAQKAETLFALIIQHYHAMLKFYREGKLKHAWKSFIQPYSMRFKALKEEIDQCSRSIDLYALTSLHINVDAIRKDQAVLSHRVDHFNTKADMIDEKLAILLSRIFQIQTETALLPSMSIAQNRIEMSDMISITSNSDLMLPIEVLRHRLAFLRRCEVRYRIDISTLWSSPHLKAWSASPDSSAIIVQGSWLSRHEINAMGTYMTDFVRRSNCMCLWALQHMTAAKKKRTTWAQILKYLTRQALQASSDTALKILGDEFNSLVISSAVSDEQWERILLKALSTVDVVYLLIDFATLEDLDLDDFKSMLDSIARLMASGLNGHPTIKIALISSTKLNLDSSAGFHKLDLDRHVQRGKRSRKMALNPRAKAIKGRIPLRTRAHDSMADE